MDRNLFKDVLTVIVFFDMFDFPVTASEAYKLISLSADKLEIDQVLEEFVRRGVVECQSGFYFLSGRKDIVEIRKRREMLSLKKIARVQKYFRWFRSLPFIRGVAISNRLAYLNAQANDDVDLFILAEPKRLWTARFWATALFTVLARRVHGKHFFVKNLFAYLRRLLNPGSCAIAETYTSEYEDRVCMPFWATPQTDVSIVREHNDCYFDFWMKLLRVEYGRDVFDRFFERNGAAEHWEEQRQRGEETRSAPQRVSEWFTRLVPESLYQSLQMKIFPRVLKERMNQGTSVVIRDDLIKLHAKDRRGDYNRWIQERVEELVKNFSFFIDLIRKEILNSKP